MFKPTKKWYRALAAIGIAGIGIAVFGLLTGNQFVGQVGATVIAIAAGVAIISLISELDKDIPTN